MTRLMVVYGKHGTDYYDASTLKLWAAACLDVLTQRYDDGWYYDPLEEKKSEPAVLTDDQIEGLPTESLRKVALEERASAQQKLLRDRQDHDWYVRMRQIVDEGDAGAVTVGSGQWRRREPKAWRLLAEHSRYEYERVEVINATKAAVT